MTRVIFFQSMPIFFVAKSYSESEEKSRYQKFVKNFATVMQHNSEQVMGLHSYSLGLNKYSDLVSL